MFCFKVIDVCELKVKTYMCWYCDRVVKESERAYEILGNVSGVKVMSWLVEKMDLWGDIFVLRTGVCLRSGEGVYLFRTDRSVAWATCGEWMMLTQDGSVLSREEMGNSWMYF